MKSSPKLVKIREAVHARLKTEAFVRNVQIGELASIAIEEYLDKNALIVEIKQPATIAS